MELTLHERPASPTGARQRHFWRRRLRNSLLLVAALIAARYWLRHAEAQLWHTGFSTGMILFAAVVFLWLLTIRKRLPGLPLGRVSTWLQAHIYVGIAVLPMFVWHTGGRWPNGVLETALAFLFCTTASSGLWLLYLCRTFPQRLSRISEQILYHRIASLCRMIAARSHRLVLQTAATSGEATLAEFYRRQLLPFFDQPPAVRFRFAPGGRRRRVLMLKLREHQRYFSPEERAASEQLFHLMRRKDDLDYQHAVETLLRAWMTVHVILAHLLVGIGLVHGVIAWTFSGVR